MCTQKFYPGSDQCDLLAHLCRALFGLQQDGQLHNQNLFSRLGGSIGVNLWITQTSLVL